MSKSVLMLVGIILLLMGIAALIPSWTWATVPAWHAWIEIVVGLIMVWVSAADKKK